MTAPVLPAINTPVAGLPGQQSLRMDPIWYRFFFQFSQKILTILGGDGIATTATDGFLYVPSVNGTPTGIPTTLTGRTPIVFDISSNKLWAYNSGWISVLLS